jgi:PHD/YefM family antitoxin component YafN of YafNO toxin-antitoxin module
MSRIRKSGHPVVLTINGKAELVVQDAESYQRLLELAERAEMIDFLQQSREDIEAGRTVDARKAISDLAKKHGFKKQGK